MTIVKSIETQKEKVWIEQHNEFFILKSQKKNEEVLALSAIQNLTLVLDMFETLIGKSNFQN